MDRSLPGIVVTGASGFIGRHFVEAVKSKYRLFCLARRSQKEAGIAANDNIRWTQVDIAHWDGLREVVKCVKDNGGADFVLHLAGYYDFTNEDNEEYERTNVQGTRSILKLAKQIGTRRFLFASSLAACQFPDRNDTINEDTPADADFPYAVSKRMGEELIKEHGEWFPSSIIRIAAIYSDWCEYPPLYVFLNTWLSDDWNARVLGGRGQSAVPYLHIQDLIRFLLTLIEKSDSLPRLSTYIASPSGYSTHSELFKTATRYYYGKDISPLLVPKFMAAPGIVFRQALGRMTGNVPFERSWMAGYIDRQLNVDASRTHSVLGWEPTPRYSILRRLLFLMENMKNHADAWHLRNEAALKKVAYRPNLLIFDELVKHREALTKEIFDFVQWPVNATRFSRYRDMDEKQLMWYITLVYQMLCVVVRTRDRTLMRNYAVAIAHRRYVEGFSAAQVCDFLLTIGQKITDALKAEPGAEDIEQRLYDHINLTFQLAADEVQDSYDFLDEKSREHLKPAVGATLVTDSADLERIVYQLEDISQDMWPEKLSEEIARLEL